MKKDIIVSHKCFWKVNGRYEIYKDDGCVYDRGFGNDIPQKYFLIRDRLMKEWHLIKPKTEILEGLDEQCSIIGLKLADRNRLKEFVSISIDDICEGFTMKKERIKVHYDGEAKGWNKAVDKINKIIKKLKQ